MISFTLTQGTQRSWRRWIAQLWPVRNFVNRYARFLGRLPYTFRFDLVWKWTCEKRDCDYLSRYYVFTYNPLRGCKTRRPHFFQHHASLSLYLFFWNSAGCHLPCINEYSVLACDSILSDLAYLLTHPSHAKRCHHPVPKLCRFAD